MKFVIISIMSGFPWGGSEELWFRTALYAADQGDDVEVWHYDWKEQTSDKIQTLINRGIKVHLIDLVPEWNPPSLLLRVMRRLKLYKEKIVNPYQGILQINPDALLVSQGDTFSFLSNKPLLQLISKLGTKCYLLSQYNYEHLILSPLQIQLAIEIINKINTFFFVSQKNLIAAQHQLATTIERSAVVQNPVNLTSKEILSFPKKEQVHFASVARLDCRFKGQDLLIAAFADPFWQDKEWVLNLYGSGPDVEYLQQLAKYYTLEDHIHFKGQVSDMTAVWQDNHIQVLCSFGEGTPLSLIEAFFCGRPAIATDVGDNAKYVMEGVTGFVIDAPTIKLIAAALVRAYEHCSQWEEMGKRAHQLASKKFDMDAGRQLYHIITNTNLKRQEIDSPMHNILSE